MVSSLIPFKNAHYRPPFTQSFRQTPHLNHQSQFNEFSPMNPSRFTISRNFSSTGAGKSLLHQTFDTKMMERNSGAPLRSSYNLNNNIEPIPSGLL
jgi:hypothetical protein